MIVCSEVSDVIANVFAIFMHVVTYINRFGHKYGMKYMGLNGINLKNSSKNQKKEEPTKRLINLC
jgi:hypothetical protein